MVVWIAILCALGSSFGIWEWDLAKDSAVWFVVAGLAMFYTASQPSQQRGLFRRALRGAVTPTALVELYIGLFVFPFLVELAVQPVLFLLIGMSVVAGTRQEFAPAKRIVDTVLAALGFTLIVYVAVRLFDDWEQVSARDTALSLALPIWLTAGLFPFLALLSLYS